MTSLIKDNSNFFIWILSDFREGAGELVFFGHRIAVSLNNDNNNVGSNNKHTNTLTLSYQIWNVYLSILVGKL